MHIPKKGTCGRTVVDTLYQHGPMTLEQGIEAHKILGTYLSRTKEVYKRAVDSGWIVLNDGVYSLSPEMKQYLDDRQGEEEEQADLTPKRTPPQFRPLSSQHIPSAQGRRPDAGPAREIHYFCGTPRPEPFAPPEREVPASEPHHDAY